MIGRGEGADTRIDNDPTSELFAEIVKDGAEWTIRDFGGSLPTILDGKHISGRTIFRPGSLLQIGDWSWTMPMPKSLAGVTITLQNVSFCVSQTTVLTRFIPSLGKKLALLTNREDRQ